MKYHVHLKPTIKGILPMNDNITISGESIIDLKEAINRNYKGVYELDYIIPEKYNVKHAGSKE